MLKRVWCPVWANGAHYLEQPQPADDGEGEIVTPCGQIVGRRRRYGGRQPMCRWCLAVLGLRPLPRPHLVGPSAPSNESD